MTGVKCKTAAQKSEGGKVNVRVMKVSYACRYHDFVQMPAIRIQGLWLEAIGLALYVLLHRDFADLHLLARFERSYKK